MAYKYNTAVPDLSNIPFKNGRYIWKESMGKTINYTYENKKGALKIIDYNAKCQVKCLNLNTGNEKWISCGSLRKGGFVTFINSSGTCKNYNHRNNAYNIKDEVKTNKHTYIIATVKYRTFKGNKNKTLINKGRVMYDVICKDCKQTFEIPAFNLLSGRCSYCSGYKIIEGKTDIPTTAPWMISYFQGGYEEAKQYSISGAKRITPKCPYCNTIHDKSVFIPNLYNNHGFKCKCSDNISFPEKFMIALLSQLNINFIHQAQSKELGFDTQGKIYDFYIPSMNCIIETHGAQHFRGEKIFHTSYEEQHKNDKYKEKIAKNNGIINYITIDCSQTCLSWLKKSIINSELNSLFDLSIVNWEKCIEYGSSNLVKEVCEYYNAHDVDIKTLSHVFNIGHKGIKTYLKRGSEIGWCKYKPNQSFFSCQPFEIYKDNRLIAYGESCKGFSKRSEDVLGEHIDCNGIRKCLIGQINEFKGYQFKLIKDLNLKREVLCNLL